MKKLLLKIYYLIIEPSFFKNPLKKYDLVIYDTIFPNPISGFRYAEFTEYLSHFRNSKIIVTPSHYQYVNQTLEQFENDVKAFKNTEPSLANKIEVIKNITNINCKLFYCVFYGAIAGKIQVLNNLKIPFIFTLYPGGGFNLNDQIVIENLKLICNSDYFKGVIATQQITVDYLLKHNICDQQKINFIFGGIVPQTSISAQKKVFFNNNKETLDICFCAAKYMATGKDKGYDVFVETAQLLAEKYKQVRFHVVGGFNEDDINLEGLNDQFTFYGYKKYEELQNIFSRMDFIFSPNRPNVLREGLFDGFPLGTVVEAALNGVIPLVTDELEQNEIFQDGEIFICKPNKESFFGKIEEILQSDLKTVSETVQKKFRLIYDNKNQLSKRIEILNKHLV